jgi:prepilin-type N-terminal cleavage/methylation domain-containing protein
MRQEQRGFSLIELLIVVAIILVIAAIAIPSFMHARMSANESSAAASLRAINTAELTYATTYPTVGYTALPSLGGAQPCTPAAATACILDDFLATNGGGLGKDGYSFTLQTAASLTGYGTLAAPLTLNQSGTRTFCSDQTSVIYYNVGASTCDSTASPLQ